MPLCSLCLSNEVSAGDFRLCHSCKRRLVRSERTGLNFEDANRKAAERRAAIEAALSCAGTADDMVLSLCPSHTAAAGVSHVKLRFAYYPRSDRRVPFDFSYNRYPDCDEGCHRADAELLYHCAACYRRSYRCGLEVCTSTPGVQDCPYCEAYSLPHMLYELGYLGDGDELDCTSCFSSVAILWHDNWRFWPDRWLAMGLPLPPWFIQLETS